MCIRDSLWPSNLIENVPFWSAHGTSKLAKSIGKMCISAHDPSWVCIPAYGPSWEAPFGILFMFACILKSLFHLFALLWSYFGEKVLPVLDILPLRSPIWVNRIPPLRASNNPWRGSMYLCIYFLIHASITAPLYNCTTAPLHHYHIFAPLHK